MELKCFEGEGQTLAFAKRRPGSDPSLHYLKLNLHRLTHQLR